MNSTNHFNSNQPKSWMSKFLISFPTIIMVLFLFPLNAAATPDFYDISGDWDSKFGVMSFKMEGVDKHGDAIVSGIFKAGNNNAPIAYGRLKRGGGSQLLQVEYYMPWRPLWGFGEFTLDSSRGVLRGKYYQAGESGNWILKRKAGGALKRAVNLNVIENPKSKRASNIFSCEGPWDSSFGKVKLTGTSLAVVKQLKGTFTRPDGKVGQITFGSFMRQPGGGILKLNYYCPWNKAKGTAQFRPDSKLGGKMLLGAYDQGGQKGTWILCRPASYN